MRPITVNNLYNFDPDFIGLLISNADWDQCWTYLGDVLENLTMSAGSTAMQFSNRLEKDLQDQEKRKYVKEFGALLGELFLFLLSNEDSNITDKIFYRLMSYHETLHTLFYIYDIDDTDEYVGRILEKKKTLSSKEQKKLLLILSLNTSLDMKEILNLIDKAYLISALVIYLGYRKIFKENIYNNKIKLFDLSHYLRKANEPVRTLLDSVHPYFLSSYLKIPDKHRIKNDINIAFRQYLISMARDLKRIKNSPQKYSYDLEKGKPVVLVVNEYFTKGHSMYRGWGRLIKSLESEFNVVLSAPIDANAGHAKEEYKNFAEFKNIGELYDIIHSCNPNIIFLPSVGMKFYNIAMANARNAPIQIMGLGHPATTMSDQVDYVISPKGLYDPVAFPNDIYVADGYPQRHTPLLTKEQFFAPLPPEEIPNRDGGTKKTIEACVVGTDLKVSYPFFKLLKEIVRDSPFPIHISFMMGVSGIDSLYIEKYIKENFPNCTYYGWQTYPDYLKNLKKADIVLNSFPFGHSGTIMDTLMCGKPCVGLYDVEPSAKTESDILNTVGLKDLFVAQNEEDYKNKFYSLSQRILNGETEFFDRDKIYDSIFAELGDYDYGKVMKWIYDNHAAMKASGQNFFEVFKDLEI